MNNQPPLTVEEIIRKIDAVKGGTLREHLSVFEALGMYFNSVQLNKVDADLVRHTANMLNRCRTNFDSRSYRKALLEQIIEALITANIIEGYISNNDLLKRDPLKAVTQIGGELLMLAATIETASK